MISSWIWTCFRHNGNDSFFLDLCLHPHFSLSLYLSISLSLFSSFPKLSSSIVCQALSFSLSLSFSLTLPFFLFQRVLAVLSMRPLVDRSARSNRASSIVFTRVLTFAECFSFLNRRWNWIADRWCADGRSIPIRSPRTTRSPCQRRSGTSGDVTGHSRPTIPSMSHATYHIKRTLVHDHIHDHIHTSLPRVATYAQPVTRSVLSIYRNTLNPGQSTFPVLVPRSSAGRSAMSININRFRFLKNFGDEGR